MYAIDALRFEWLAYDSTTTDFQSVVVELFDLIPNRLREGLNMLY